MSAYCFLFRNGNNSLFTIPQAATGCLKVISLGIVAIAHIHKVLIIVAAIGNQGRKKQHFQG
jgi:hypothetical protein